MSDKTLAQPRPTFKSYGSFLLALIIFGSNGVYAHYITLTSNQIVWWRLILGPATLFVLFLITRKHFTFYKHWRDFIQLGISGCSMAVSWLLLFAAYNYIGIGVSTVLHYVGPVIVIATSPFFFKERIHVTTIIGIVIVILGVVLINFDNFGSELSFIGVLISLVSAVAFASATIFNKRCIHIVGIENVLFQMLFALVIVSFVVGFSSGFKMDLKPSDWPPLLALGILNTGIALFLYFWPFRQLPAQAISVCGYLEAVSAVVFGILLLHQDLSVLAFVGSACVIGGAVFSEIGRQRRRKKVLKRQSASS